MRLLKNIKHFYKCDPCFYYPTKEEIDYYNLSDNILKGWITEKLTEYKKDLSKELDSFEKDIESNQSYAKYHIRNVFDILYLCLDNYEADQSYYDDFIYIFKEMYEKCVFDYLSYISKETIHEFAYLLKNENPDEFHTTVAWEKNQKYGGILIQTYYNNPKTFEELLIYFKDVIYQKYGLYLQYDMSILIQFCIEFNLPYVDLLKEAHKKAMKLDYPSNHNFKYQFCERSKNEWEDI